MRALLLDTSKHKATDTPKLILSLDFRPLLARLHEPAHLERLRQSEQYLTTEMASICAMHLPNLRFFYLDGLTVENPDRPISPVIKAVKPCQILLLSTTGTRTLNCGLVPEHKAFHHVMFLDISHTVRPEGFQRLFNSTSFPNLRVLKLRGLKLTDSMLPNMILHTGLRLWSLDIRENLLTGVGIWLILDNCIRSYPAMMPCVKSKTLREAPEYEQDATIDLYRQAKSLSLTCRPDDEESFSAYLKAHGDLMQHCGIVLDEDDDLMKATGLTHLYISGNKLNEVAVDAILEHSSYLRVLDIGSIMVRPSNPGTNFSQTTTAGVHLFSSYSSRSRTEVLRIHHSIITGVDTPLPRASPSKYSLQSLRDLERRQASPDWESYNPQDNYYLHELTLTDLPTKSYGPIAHRLIEFLNNCVAQERYLLDASVAVGLRSRRSPILLSGLRMLRLEFMGEDTRESSGSYKSTSEDRDADNFLRESAQDFSFFNDNQPLTSTILVAEEEYVHDVLAMLKDWRKYSVFRWGGKLEIVLPEG
jgi:hypothetical protein